MSDGKQVSVWFDPETVDCIDQFCDEYSLSRSSVIRDIVQGWIEDGEEPALEEAVDEWTIKAAKAEARYKRMRKKQKYRERRINWRDRIKGFFAARVEGNEAYSVDGMRELAQGYIEDAEIYAESEEEIREKTEQVREWIEIYDLAVWCREYAEQTDTEIQTGDVDGWFEVAEDLFRLRSRIEEVTDHIQHVANRDGVGMDHEAVIDSISRRWSVCRGSVILLLEQMVSDEADSTRDMIRLGGNKIQIPQQQPEALPEGGRIREQFEAPLDQPNPIKPIPGNGFDLDQEDSNSRQIDPVDTEWMDEIEAEIEDDSEGDR